MRTYIRRRPESQVIKDVRDLCRLCLQKSEENVPIFDENSDNICAALALRIMICVGLEITREASLPNLICTDCYKELSRYYAFRKKCELSYQKLKRHIQAEKEESVQMLKEKKEIDNGQIFDNYTPNVTGPSDIDETECVSVHETVQFHDNVKCSLNNMEESDSKIIPPSDDDNLDISTFLSSILVQLGVITRHDDRLAVADPNVNTLELTMGNDNSVTLELMEEDEEENDQPNSDSVDKSLTTEYYYSESNNELTQTVHSPHSPEATNETEDCDLTTVKIGEASARGGGRAWCSVCRKWLANPGTLRRHKLVHTGERPYSCRECGRTFTQRGSLKRHRLVHLERRPFECDRCVKSFTQRSALVNHMAGHAPPHSRALMLHRCVKCPKVFLYMSSLSRHMRMHYGYVYECGGCDRTFTDKSSLIRHVRNTNHTARRSSGGQTSNGPTI